MTFKKDNQIMASPSFPHHTPSPPDPLLDFESINTSNTSQEILGFLLLAAARSEG